VYFQSLTVCDECHGGERDENVIFVTCSDAPHKSNFGGAQMPEKQ